MTAATDHPPRVVAITGGSGFIGRRLAPALAQAGWRVRLLLRRDPVQPGWLGMEPQIVAGDLRDRAALLQLVQGVDAIVHVGGLIKAARRAQFMAVNAAATAVLAEVAAAHVPAAHFLHVSTIAAREPQLSDYAGSKRAGEDAVLARVGARATVIRPPAVYGPGDPESLIFFQLAQRRAVPLLGAPTARAAMIHVDDLVALLVAQLAVQPNGAVWTAADARPDGYRWQEVMASAARAVDNATPCFFHVPYALLRTVALAGDVGRGFGSATMLSSQKLRELRHADWSVRDAERARPVDWRPRFSLDAGFADAVAWYRRAGWLQDAAAT